MVEGQPGLDVLLEQLVDEAGVEVEALGVDRSAVGTHARPRRGEAVRLQAERRHELDVGFVAVVVVARDITVVGVDDGSGNAGEGVPDGVGAALFVRRALDLVRGGRGAEQKVGGEHASALCGGVDEGHPFTAPCMIPDTSCLPATTNRISSGMVESRTPARTRE